MKRLGYVGFFAAALVLALSANARAGSVFSVPQPRNASVYVVYNDSSDPLGTAAGYAGSNYNDMETNWYQDSDSTSNSGPGFFQINEGSGGTTTTSVTGAWTTDASNSSLSDFTLTVKGANATYASSFARLWDPLAGTDAGWNYGGTFTSYTYTITATGLTPTTTADGWEYSQDVTPSSITGSFVGTYVANPEPGNPSSNTDTLVADLSFSNTLYSAANFVDDGYGFYSTFATGPDGAVIADSNQFGYAGTVEDVSVPEPISMVFFGTGLVAVGGYMARRKMLRKA